MLSDAPPMTEHRQFHQRDRQILNKNILKDPHYAEFVTNLKTYIFAKDGID